MSSMNLFVAEVLIKFPKTVRFCKLKIEDNHRVEAVQLADFKWRKAANMLQKSTNINKENMNAKYGFAFEPAVSLIIFDTKV